MKFAFKNLTSKIPKAFLNPSPILVIISVRALHSETLFSEFDCSLRKNSKRVVRLLIKFAMLSQLKGLNLRQSFEF